MCEWGITWDNISIYRAIELLRVGDNLGDKVGDKWWITFCNRIDTLSCCELVFYIGIVLFVAKSTVCLVVDIYDLCVFKGYLGRHYSHCMPLTGVECQL